VAVTLSLCLIVKNEEAVLGRCLDSVKSACDEIIIADTGSTDATKEIALRYTDKVLDFKWIDDFAAARNFAFDNAASEYIMWLDADDVIEPQDLQKLLKLKEELPPFYDAVNMDYKLGFDAQGNVTSSLRRNRIVKRSRGFRWVGAVHEYIAVSGPVFQADIAVTHRPLDHDAERNLRIYRRRLAAGEKFNARDQYYYANELNDHRLFEEAILWYDKFLDGGEGWVEDCLGACRKAADAYKTLGNMAQSVRYLLKSFTYDLPRAEFCVRLGHYFRDQGKLAQAVYWYEAAAALKYPEDNIAYIERSYWTWIPHIELCLCYDKLGQYEKASEHNEIAARYIPNENCVRHNREYFAKKLGK